MSKRSKKYNTNDTDLLIPQFNDHASIRKMKVYYPEIFPDTFQFTLVSGEDANKVTINKMLRNHLQVRQFQQ